METFAFYVFAAITVIASLLVVAQRNPMYSVMLLITSFGGLAGLYVLLDAPFTAVTQIIIYAGAIVVLFLFVVMLLNVPREEPLPGAVAGLLGPSGMRLGAVLSVVLAVELFWALSRLAPSDFDSIRAAWQAKLAAKTLAEAPAEIPPPPVPANDVPEPQPRPLPQAAE